MSISFTKRKEKRWIYETIFKGARELKRLKEMRQEKSMQELYISESYYRQIETPE